MKLKGLQNVDITQVSVLYCPGSEIAANWSPMRLKIECWRPEFQNCLPAGDFTFKENRFRITQFCFLFFYFFIFFYRKCLLARGHMNLAASCYFNADLYAVKSPSFPNERWRTYRDPGIDGILNKAPIKSA